MKKILFFVLLIVIACTPYKQKHNFSSLNRIDSLLNANSDNALDSLNNLKIDYLSSENKAYYNLLLTIALDKRDFAFRTDSSISEALIWFEQSKDNYNYIRSLTYKAIVRYSINTEDTLSFNLLKKAEENYFKFKQNDNHLLSLIYSYLGKINKADKNFEGAEKYFEKSREINLKTKNNYNYIVSLTDIIWNKINLKDYSTIPKYINELNNVDSIPESLRKKVLNTKSAYFASIGDFNEAINLTKKTIELNEVASSNDNLLYALSAYYLKLNKIDSSVYYAEGAVKALSEKFASSKYTLYKHLADVYKIKGDYAKSAETYYKAYEFHQQYLSEVSSKKILELEKRYDLESKDFQLHLANQRNSQLTIIIVAVSLIFILLVIILWFRIKITKREFFIIKQREEISAAKIEAKQKKQKVINDFLKISLTLHPEFTSNYLQIVNSKYNLSPELYKEFVKINKNFNNEYRKNINDIIEKELNDLLDFVPAEIAENLSANEKVILFLTDEGYTTTQIAELLNTTTNSIRTSRLRLISKINESTLLDEESKNSLKNFLHLQ